MEITSLSLTGLQHRLLEQVRTRIQNGELTERGLALQTGISQPHIHNALKGARVLSLDLADVILKYLNINPLDLFSRDELTQYLTATNPHRESRLSPVPVLSGLLGLHQPLPRRGPHREVHAVPFHLTESATEPLIASLAADPDMEPLFADRDLVLLDQSEAARSLVQSGGYYAVRTQDGLCVRSLLRRGDTLFLITERNRSHPASWPQVSVATGNILDIVLARVIWLNRRRRWEDHVA